MSEPILFGLLLAAVLAVGFLSTYELKGVLMSAKQDVVDAVVAQLGKAKGEILAAIEELQVREPDVDLSALVAAAQALDDVVPDAPVEEPVSE